MENFLTPRDLFNGIETLISGFVGEIFLPYIFAVLNPDKWLDVEIIFIIAALGSYLYIISRGIHFVLEMKHIIQMHRLNKMWWKTNCKKTWPFWYIYFAPSMTLIGFVALVPTALFLPLVPLFAARTLLITLGAEESLWSGDTASLLILMYWLATIALIMRKGFALQRQVHVEMDDKLHQLLEKVDEKEFTAENAPDLTGLMVRFKKGSD